MTMSDMFQRDRLEMIFNFASHKSKSEPEERQFGFPSGASGKGNNIMDILENMRYSERLYVVSLLHFFGRVACVVDQTETVFKLLKGYKGTYQVWVEPYLVNLEGMTMTNPSLTPLEIDMITESFQYVSITQPITIVSLVQQNLRWRAWDKFLCKPSPEQQHLYES